MASKNNIYVVIANRYGNPEMNSYLVGVFGKKHAAIEAAEKEEEYRGKKYTCYVIETVISDKHIQDSESIQKVVRDAENMFETWNKFVNEQYLQDLQNNKRKCKNG